MATPNATGSSASQPEPGAPANRAWTGVDQRVQLRMDREDFRRVADVRREVWSGGMTGGLGGLASGYLAFAALRESRVRRYREVQLGCARPPRRS